MKTTLFFPSLALLLALAGCQTGMQRETESSANSRVQVNFETAERFTDVRSQDFGKTDSSYLDNLRDFLQRTAVRYLDPGQTLTVTFNDVDMAGDFEPWRGPQAQDVRIVKPIYPPRLEFNYTVMDAEGNIVNEGSERLIDLAFNLRVGLPNRDDPLYYEKQLLRDWLARNLG